MKKKATKTARVATALSKKALTSKEIASRFDVPNVRAMIYDLKRKGMKVLKRSTTTTKGLTTRYSIWSSPRLASR
jgi:transcription initiation factor IIE alpha subunit